MCWEGMFGGGKQSSIKKNKVSIFWFSGAMIHRNPNRLKQLQGKDVSGSAGEQQEQHRPSKSDWWGWLLPPTPDLGVKFSWKVHNHPANLHMDESKGMGKQEKGSPSTLQAVPTLKKWCSPLLECFSTILIPVSSGILNLKT